jgi:hypothetical protein
MSYHRHSRAKSTLFDVVQCCSMLFNVVQCCSMLFNVVQCCSKWFKMVQNGSTLLRATVMNCGCRRDVPLERLITDIRERYQHCSMLFNVVQNGSKWFKMVQCCCEPRIALGRSKIKVQSAAAVVARVTNSREGAAVSNRRWKTPTLREPNTIKRQQMPRATKITWRELLMSF